MNARRAQGRPHSLFQRFSNDSTTTPANSSLRQSTDPSTVGPHSFEFSITERERRETVRLYSDVLQEEEEQPEFLIVHGDRTIEASLLTFLRIKGVTIETMIGGEIAAVGSGSGVAKGGDERRDYHYARGKGTLSLPPPLDVLAQDMTVPRTN